MSVGLLVVRLLYCFCVLLFLSKWFTFSIILFVAFCRVVSFTLAHNFFISPTPWRISTQFWAALRHKPGVYFFSTRYCFLLTRCQRAKLFFVGSLCLHGYKFLSSYCFYDPASPGYTADLFPIPTNAWHSCGVTSAVSRGAL